MAVGQVTEMWLVFLINYIYGSWRL